MKLYGLIGFPLGHSFSHHYFTEKFEREGLAGYSYRLFELPDIEQLPALIEGEPLLRGFNVTIPWKVKVIEYLDETDPEAMSIGAVNTVTVTRGDGGCKMKGYNSDAPAFRETLMEYLSAPPSLALVLGTGGAARSVTSALKQMGTEVVPVSRSSVPGGYRYDTLPPELLRRAGVIVNTTPLGMAPEINTLPPIDYSCLTEGQLLYDLVYNPPLTRFLLKGTEQGCATVNGMAMLRRQAELAWQIWSSHEDSD